MEAAKQRARLMTAEDLAGPDVPEKWVELIEGELVEMTPAGHAHNQIAERLMVKFYQFADQHPGLVAYGANDGFHIRRNPDTVLSPDCGLFRKRPSSDATWHEYAPELVVEVLSTSNTQAEMAYKRQCFFDAGTEQFWLIDPKKQSLQIFFRDGRIELFPQGATIECEGIANGLCFSLAEVFPG